MISSISNTNNYIVLSNYFFLIIFIYLHAVIWFQVCEDRDKMIHHIISECSNLAQKKYKTRHN